MRLPVSEFGAVKRIQRKHLDAKSLAQGMADAASILRQGLSTDKSRAKIQDLEDNALSKVKYSSNRGEKAQALAKACAYREVIERLKD